MIGTVSEIHTYDTYTIYTITVKEWLYNPLPVDTIKVESKIGTNLRVEDEVEFTLHESVLLMLKDVNLNKQLFDVTFGFPGKHPVSDRDAVIKELKAQGKWQDKNPIDNISNNTEIEYDVSEDSNNNSENVDSIPHRLPLTFGPETLNKLKKDPNFIAAYGSIPTFGSSEEREQWLGKLNNVYQEAISEMSKYMYPNGPVTAFGYTIDGVLQVGINKTVEKPFTDEIYKIFDSQASLMGIKEIPVVFVHQDLAVPSLKPVVKETANFSASGDKNSVELNNNSSENKSSKTNSVPGFGLLEGLACLYGGRKLRKK